MLDHFDKKTLFGGIFAILWITTKVRGEAAVTLYTLIVVLATICLAMSLIRETRTYAQAKVDIAGLWLGGVALISNTLVSLGEDGTKRIDTMLYIMGIGLFMILVASFSLRYLKPLTRKT